MMNFDTVSQGSDEGVEVLTEHGLQFTQDFMFIEDLAPEFLEAKTIYLLLPKNVPVSRISRLQWLLDRLNTTISVSDPDLLENSKNLEVISAIPREQNINLKCNRFLVTYRTEVKFIAHSYRFVYCLDMSPSHASVGTDGSQFLFDQILQTFKISLEALSEQFTGPGNSLVFRPSIYLTIMASTPFFSSTGQQVILKGIQLTPQNLTEIIKCVQAHYHLLQGKIADACMQALEKIDIHRVFHDSSLGGDPFDPADRVRLSKISMVTPDANFVNMLRYAMLAIYLLPETSLSHILVITDGVVSLPDSNVMETMLHQLHYDAISVSFLKLGASFHPQSAAGLVTYIDLLYFFAQSTLGTCLETFPDIARDPSLAMNFYQEIFLLWSFHTSNKIPVQICDSSRSWKSINENLYNLRLPTLLTKRQTEDSTNSSLLLLLARRMREGFTVDNIFYMNGNLEVKLIHQWKSSVYIHYKLMAHWPIIKNLTHFEVYICAPYEFFYDLTCLIKKETKSVFRQAIVQRFWSRLSQISTGDLPLAVHLSNYTANKEWCILPDSVKSGLPVFTNNPPFTDPAKLVLTARFIAVWQTISQMETSHWRKWYHTHKISLILTHDTPLPTNLYMSSCPSQRYQVVQCRQAVVALYGMLSAWSSFILIDNHTYLKFMHNESETQPVGFCVVRVSSKFPSVVLNLGFSTNTPGKTRVEVCDDLKQQLVSLSYIPKANEPGCCVILQKPLEKILIRYERVPNTYTTVVFPDGTQPGDNPPNLSSPVSGSLFTTLSRSLFHKRWIWSAMHPSNPRLLEASLSRILNTLTRMRLKEGYHFAYSSSGIVTMVLEVSLEENLSCIVQYILFPPYLNWGDDFLSGSEDDVEPVPDVEAELQMVTEVWIEPQYGKVASGNPRLSYLNNKTFYQIAEAIMKVDLRCINVLLTMEHTSLMCQHKAVHNFASGTDLNTTRTSFSKKMRKNSKFGFTDVQHVPDDGSPLYPIVTPRIEYIPFKFDPIGLIHLCQQTEMLFSMLREEKANIKNPDNLDRANKLLLDNIFEHFSLLHDRELDLSKDESDSFTKLILARHKRKSPHSCPITENSALLDSRYRWKCYMKGVSVTHVIMTFLPGSVEDLKALTQLNPVNTHSDMAEADERASSRNSNISDVPINIPNILCLPVYVFDCPLKLLVNSYLEHGHGQSGALDDVFVDRRFKHATDGLIETKEKLKGSDTESCEDMEPPDLRNIREHCIALEMTHTKCFVLSLFLALHDGIYIHNSDVQSAMDLCEDEPLEVDITDYLTKICSHVRQTRAERISTSILNEAHPCSEIKNLHMLIKKKFFKMVCTSFNQVPSNGEYYYFSHLCAHPEEKINDSDDEASCTSEIEFRTERDMSIYSEGPHLLKETNAGFIDVAKMSDVSPLFLHFVCTLRYNDGGYSNTSVRLLPTCLGELTQNLEKPTEFMNKSRLQVNLDICCLTLPPRVQNILHDYTQQGMRATSFCSDGGFQRTSSITSEASGNSELPLPSTNLTELQKQSVDNLYSEIKWMLEDEICTTLLDADPVTIDTLEYVIDHVVKSHGTRDSCQKEEITLDFVFVTEDSHRRFLAEFRQIELPEFLNYKLCQEQDYYYVAKNSFLRDSDTYVNLSFTARSNSTADLPLNGQDIDSTGREDTMSQQSEITSGSGTGTEGGYDEDVSEDDEDYDWLVNLHMKRAYLPNFWLILKVEQDRVHVYFHSRFIELNTPHVDSYIGIKKAVCDLISELCKKVNQFLLLQNLYDSRSCDSLLEPDDTPLFDTSSSRNLSYSRRGIDADVSDDPDTQQLNSRSLSEASLHFKPGDFSCPIVWEKLFVLHPRLKTGSGNKSGISRGIMALKNILEKFSVANRHNMFVYKDNEDNVFYLRLYESTNVSYGSRLSIKPENENTFSRSPSIASLPVAQNTKPNLAISDQSIASVVSSDVLRPRVRSFGERESRLYDSRDSREKINEDSLILRVHGITNAGTDVQCELVEVLQNRLDDAVLDFLSMALARNSMCPLTPEDVRFIQKPQNPDHLICLTLQDFVLHHHKLNSFIYYLKQNLLQFLNLPKYTDSRAEFHFTDYTVSSESCLLPFDSIFIYNQSHTPSSGSKGMACIILALINSSSRCSTLETENQFETVFITKNYETCVRSHVIGQSEACPDSYLEFRLWKQGRINIDTLSKRLAEAVSHATWDIVTEYYLLKKPLCVEEFRNNLYTHKKKVEIDALSQDLDKEIGYTCELDFTFDRNVRSKVKSLLPKKVDAHYFPTRKFNKRSTAHSSRATNLEPAKQTSVESNDDRVLSMVYSKFLPSWMEFGDRIKAPAVKKHVIKISNRHTPSFIVRELKSMLPDGPKTFRVFSTHSLNSKSEDVFVPFVFSIAMKKYVILSSSFLKWQDVEHVPDDLPDGLNPQNLKHTQFVPVVIDNVLIPRQKIFWISVECDSIIIYAYNWAKEDVDRLEKNCQNLSQWLTLRSCYLNSVISQKLGLFYNQPLTRKCFMLNTNNYYSLICNLDAMTKFPRDLCHKKGHPSSFNLPMVLEAFRDTFCNTKYTSSDSVVIFTIEMKEMKSMEKKSKDEMKKLHSMYQSRTGSTSVPQLTLLMQNSRILHYVHTPLLFLPRWRLKCAATRDHPLIPYRTIQMAEKMSDREREIWHSELCYSFFSEYRHYLHNLGFTPLQIDDPHPGSHSMWTKDKSSHKSVFYIQRTILGGILIFTVSFEEPFFVTKLHAIECNRLQNLTTRASVNGFTLSFLDECDKIKILMHLHSFTYDYHLRSTYNYISGCHGKLPERYNVHQFLDDFMKYYTKAPNFARNLIHSDFLLITNLLTEGKQLYDYLLNNVGQYGFKVLEMEDTVPEYILVQVTTARQVSYTDAHDRKRTDDFDVTLVVYNLCTPFDPTDKVLRLKYYLILTSKRESYPLFENEQKLGKFRTVSSTAASSLLEKSLNDLELSLQRSESNEGSAGEDPDKGLSRSPEDKLPLSKLLANVTIMQESVNYLGYYSSHEQIMQQLILEKAKATQKDIRDMVSKGMVHCRTSLLWNRMISPQDSTPLTFEEFIELKDLAKLTPLPCLNPNLGSLLNQNLSWYQGLAKLLLVKYVDQHRIFTSADGHMTYYVILHPRYYGAFMLLSIDLHTFRGELYAVYREPNKRDDTDPLGLGYEKSLRDGFVNCICFYIWQGMVCGFPEMYGTSNNTPRVNEDLNFYVAWLARKLRDMSEDILHFEASAGSSEIETTTHADTELDVAEIDRNLSNAAKDKNLSKYVRDAINFNVGAILCQRYLYGSIGLDELCSRMIEEDLKSYLIEVPHMPSEFVTIYGLVHEGSPRDDDDGRNEQLEITENIVNI